jgi:hypothetical protein
MLVNVVIKVVTVIKKGLVMVDTKVAIVEKD